MTSNAADHGPTCAETPIDHRCGSTEQDQGVTWAENWRITSEQVRHIASLHQKVVGPAGTTDGLCAECGHLYPCQTVHIANGWGHGEDTCYATGWCHHAVAPVAVLYEETQEGVLP